MVQSRAVQQFTLGCGIQTVRPGSMNAGLLMETRTTLRRPVYGIVVWGGFSPTRLRTGWHCLTRRQAAGEANENRSLQHPIRGSTVRSGIST